MRPAGTQSSTRRTPLLLLGVILMVTSITTPLVSAGITCGDAQVPDTVPLATPAPSRDASFPQGGGRLTIFAAVSLTDAFAAMEQHLEEAHPDLDIVVETAGSQTLVTQLDQGARADVLATADSSTMEDAMRSGLIDGDPTAFTSNRLIIVTPADNPAGIRSIEDLARDNVSLLLASRAVPAGRYSHRAFCDYVIANDASDGFLDQLNANLVSEEQDVRSVLAKIQLGEADAGVIYASDAAAARLAGRAVTAIEFPAGVDTTAIYPIAPVVGGNTTLAHAFISYVTSEEGQRILSEYGFSPLP